jgi:hypothetical protein
VGESAPSSASAASGEHHDGSDFSGSFAMDERSRPWFVGVDRASQDHHAVDLVRSWGKADKRLAAVHLVFGLAERWLLGTHHGVVGGK